MQIKKRQAITWQDLPKIESRFFASSAIRSAITNDRVDEIFGLRDILQEMQEYTKEEKLKKIEEELGWGKLYLLDDRPLSPQFQCVESKGGKQPGEVEDIRAVAGDSHAKYLISKLRHPISLGAKSESECEAPPSPPPPPPQPQDASVIAASQITTLPITVESEKKSSEKSLITPIYPVRYAYANFFQETPEAAENPPPLMEMLNVSDSAETRGYVARVLRPGWIYIREEDGPGGGHFHIFKYDPIESDGQLTERFPKYQFANGIDAKGGLKEDTSGGMRGGYPFVFVRDEVTEISIVYTEHELHPKVIDELNGNPGVRSASMQRIKLKGDDAACVPASAESLSALVEDYREQQQRILNLKSSETDPSIKNLALDLLTTQASYDMDADQIATALRKKSKPGETARIVALHDPVGRQRDILEIHNKLAIWEKSYASKNVYPFTIGQLIEQLQASDDPNLKEILDESINWTEYNQYWKDIDKEFALFAERKKQFADLYQSFMNGPNTTGKVGSLDTYFKTFFCRHETEPEAAAKELGKLCEIVADVYYGILSSAEGTAAIEHLMEDYENDNNVYVAGFRVFREIVTKPQYKAIDWAKVVGKPVDRLLQQLGPTWGKLAAFSLYEGQLAKRAGNKFVANAFKFTVNEVLPHIYTAMGIMVDNENRVRYTPQKLGEILAGYMQKAANAHPGAADKTLRAAERRLAQAKKLFNWGQSTRQKTIPYYIELSQVEVIRHPGKRFSFVIPESVGELSGILAEGAFAGISIFTNFSTIHQILFQAEYLSNDPLKRGSVIHDSIQITSALGSAAMDVATISRTVVGSSAMVARNISTKMIAALAPKLSAKADSLGALLVGKAAGRVIAVANLASAISSVWSGINSWQSGNRGEAAGHFTLAVGSVAFLAGVFIGAGSTTAAVGGATTASGVGALPGLVITAVGVLALGVGVTLLWIYGKSDFQLLLENCFWGVSKQYGFWDSERDRDPINKRLSTATEFSLNSMVLSSFRVELQEFMNYLYMPAVEIDSTEGLLDFKGDLRTYSFDFTLPGFQEGVSDIRCEVRTRHLDSYVPVSGLWRHNKELTESFADAVGSATLKHEGGIARIGIKLETKEDVKLFWAYQPKPTMMVPARYLTEDGIAGEPVVGMIDEDLV